MSVELPIHGVSRNAANRFRFPVEYLVSFLSRNFTLEPGDLILTGTPSRVSPIHPGDVVDVEIEGTGILSNPVLGS